MFLKVWKWEMLLPFVEGIPVDGLHIAGRRPQ